MEIIVGLLVIAGLGYLVYRSSVKPAKEAIAEAPYKVETPVAVATAPETVNTQITDSVTTKKPKKPTAPKKPATKPKVKKAA